MPSSRTKSKANTSISKNVFWKINERLISQLVSFVVSLVLARLLLPNDYGVVAIIMIFINIANVFVSTGLSTSLVQKKGADQLDFCTCFYASLLVSIVIYLSLFFLAPIISNFYDNNSLSLILRVFSTTILFAPLTSMQDAAISRDMKFKKYFLATLIGSLLSGVVGIIMAFKGFGPWALVAQHLLSSFLNCLILTLTVRWLPSFQFSFIRLKSLWKYGWKVLFEGLANQISSQFRNLIIGKVYTDADLGFYTKAQSFPSLFTNNISQSISAVMFPALSNVQDQKDRLIYLTRKSVRISSYILFPMLFGLAAVAMTMVPVLLTDKWNESIPYLYIFCFTTVLTVGMYSRHEALKASGRSDIFMLEHMISRIVGIVLLLLVFRISVMAIALSGIASGLILTATIMFTSKKFTGYRYRDQVKDVIGLLLMSAIMFLPVFFMNYLPINKVVLLVLQVVVGIGLYLILSIIFKPEGFVFFLRLLKKIPIFNKKANAPIRQDKVSTTILMVVTILLSFCVACLLKFVPLNGTYLVLIQLGGFLVSFVLLSIFMKPNIFDYLSLFIDKIINEYETKEESKFL